MGAGPGEIAVLSTHCAVLETDPRWQLVERITGSRHFTKSPLLTRFLLHVCAEALEGRSEEISEYQIGLRVFDRPVGYKTVEDNIVRNYARQLRKRLGEYFAAEGREEPLQVEIPVGGYVPVFSPREGRREATVAPRFLLAKEDAHTVDPTLSDTGGGHPAGGLRRVPWRSAVALLLYSVVLVCASVSSALWLAHGHVRQSPSHLLWSNLFGAEVDTNVVPADCGFNILQELSRKRVPAASYMNDAYLTMPLPKMDAHSATDLRTQRYTSFVDLEIVSKLAQLPEVEPKRFVTRFPRGFGMEELKRGNTILLGSIGSNPWSEIVQSNLNFRFVYRNEMNDAWIVNQSPKPGESRTYESQWDKPAHPTYAVIAFMPSLDGSGHILLIEGLDVAGTQAAAETLFRGDTVAPILKLAAMPGGGLRPFEILLESTSFGSNSGEIRVIASRLYS